MATINAFIRSSTSQKKATIRFRIRDGRDKQFFYKSKLQVTPALWDAKKQKIKSKVVCDERVRTKFNRTIADIFTTIEEVYEKIRFCNDISSTKLQQEVDSYLYPNKSKDNTSVTYLLEVFIENKKFSDWRKRAYMVIIREIKRYEIFKQERLYIDTFTKDSIKDFEKFLEKEHLLDNHSYNDVQDSRKPKPRSRNTINGVLSKLRTFFIWLNKNDYIQDNPFNNYPIEDCIYGTPIYITIEERNKLYHTQMPTVSLERVKDIFVFQCLIGCRVGDLIRLTKGNVINNAIEYIPRKTKEGTPLTVRVPLNQIANEIIAKYSDNSSTELLPFISEQKYNIYIKECFKYAKLTRMVTVLNPLTRLTEQKPLCDIVSSHMARRTFIGNLYKKVSDPNLICALSGHKEGSKAFYRYRDIDEEMKCKLVQLLE